MTHDDSTRSPRGQLPGGLPAGLPVKMRSPADMAAMLPYLLGFYPDDSIVAVGLQGSSLRQGGAIRLDIPDDPQSWPLVASESARLLLELSEERDRRPAGVLLYLCRDSTPGAPPVAAALRPLADHLVRAFRALDLPVKEALCLCDGRWRSYLCLDPACCDPAGTPVHSGHDPGAAVAAATFAGLAPRGSRKAITDALGPVTGPVAERQREALQRHADALLTAVGEQGGRDRLLDRTGRLIDEAVAEFRAGALLLDDERAARLILGLQDKISRDRAAEYAEAAELAPAQRLWRFLARRCVPPFQDCAAAPLTLLAWTAWLAGDSAISRVVLSRALDLDPDYTLAQLLYHSLNTGLEPDQLRETVRAERARRHRPGEPPGTAVADDPEQPGGPVPGGPVPGGPTPSGPAPGGADRPGGPAGRAQQSRPATHTSDAGAPGVRIPGQRCGGGSPPPPRLPGGVSRPPGSDTPPSAAAAGQPAAGHRARPARSSDRRTLRTVRDTSIGA
ncbi:hypothetical protein P3T37_005487 [Kitasatospora sp. MAA4]|uniref:DUF4192 domain-containing protein n=1 Tax=Kitasatospora sp. MAA4 TaxID=3035093 RepID=UPI00247690EC|nr:DUF4192 domain-containing protein [Kitasatospora sp. MAA4]MDH6136068.1 hypothetical protein [Kitasatospora sp. MAA4]